MTSSSKRLLPNLIQGAYRSLIFAGNIYHVVKALGAPLDDKLSPKTLVELVVLTPPLNANSSTVADLAMSAMGGNLLFVNVYLSGIAENGWQSAFAVLGLIELGKYMRDRRRYVNNPNRIRSMGEY